MSKYKGPSTREELYDLYVVKQMTLGEIASLYGADFSAVYQWLKRFGIKARRNGPRKGRLARKRHPNWKGGISPAIDGRIRINTLSERERVYRYILVWEKHFGPVPDGYVIHHIDNDCTNDSIENLTLLTRADHARLHGLERRRVAGRFA